MNLKVISFNIRNCDDKNGHSVKERMPRISKIISDVNPDIIGLQEVRPHWEDFLKENFSADYEIFNKYRAPEGDVESSPILWKKEKFQLIEKGYFWYSDTPEIQSKGWDEVYNCHRMCCYVVLKDRLSSKRFAFFNTHYGFGDNCQIKSSQLIKKYTDKLNPLPIFITGDFNMTPDSKGYGEITKYFTDLNTVTANYKGTTYHGYDRANITDKHIDYCFINQNVTAISYKILDKTFDGKFPSDHYGLFVELKV